MFVCISTGLWGGLLVGLQTEYFTSNRYKPVQVSARARLGLSCPKLGWETCGDSFNGSERGRLPPSNT